MQLKNVIVVYDVYVTVGDGEEAAIAAREAVLAAIADGSLTPSDQNALPVRAERNIRESWLTERPFVGADVSDEDFEILKGKTTLDVFNMLHTKEQPATAKPKK